MSATGSPVVVEGDLCKWTNYWNGWQPRWFVLEQGVLTYYKSHDEVNQGCKGSVKVSACEIVPHALDSKRLDIIIPSEQHYYLRALSETERQKWLVALGSVKQAAFSAETATALAKTSPAELATVAKKKKSELRLYCDLLMQQVHAIKTSDDFNEKTQAAELLNTTCDMFIRCLDECMKSTETGNEEAESKDSRPIGSTQSAITGMVGGLEKQKKSLSLSQKPPSGLSEQIGRVCPLVDPIMTLKSQQQDRNQGESSLEEDPSDRGQELDRNDKVPTFFSLMKHSFCNLKLQDTKIPLDEFLLCCQAILPVFDVLGSTTFAPVKMDIQGNISKLNKRKNETNCKFLQHLLEMELEQRGTSAANCATVALLWLKRALAFIAAFLGLACEQGDIDLALCATKAYEQTLKKHHNFVVKGIFSLALRGLARYPDFIVSLAPTEDVARNPGYEATLKRHGKEYSQKLQHVVTIIDTFYVRNDIVSPQNL